MKGLLRLIQALDFGLENVNLSLEYNVNNSTLSKHVLTFNGSSERCKAWLKSISDFASFNNVTNNDQLNIAYLASSGDARDFIENVFRNNPDIGWNNFYFKMLLRFTKEYAPIILINKVSVSNMRDLKRKPNWKQRDKDKSKRFC